MVSTENEIKNLALLNEILGWDFGTRERFLQRMKNWENATLEYNRTASAPQQEEVLVAVLISRSPKEVRNGGTSGICAKFLAGFCLGISKHERFVTTAEFRRPAVIPCMLPESFHCRS